MAKSWANKLWNWRRHSKTRNSCYTNALVYKPYPPTNNENLISSCRCNYKWGLLPSSLRKSGDNSAFCRLDSARASACHCRALLGSNAHSSSVLCPQCLSCVQILKSSLQMLMIRVKWRLTRQVYQAVSVLLQDVSLVQSSSMSHSNFSDLQSYNREIRHVKNIPHNAMFHWNFQKYSVRVLYAIIDWVCRGIPKWCIVGYSLTCPILNFHFWVGIMLQSFNTEIGRADNIPTMQLSVGISRDTTILTPARFVHIGNLDR